MKMNPSFGLSIYDIFASALCGDCPFHLLKLFPLPWKCCVLLQRQWW